MRTRQYDDLGLRTNQLVCGIESRPDTFVDVAITVPYRGTVPAFLMGTKFRRGKATNLKSEQKFRKYATAFRIRPNVTGFV